MQMNLEMNSIFAWCLYLLKNVGRYLQICKNVKVKYVPYTYITVNALL